jgi:amidase
LESLGCLVEDALPAFNFDKLWEATIRLRAWQQGSLLLAHYNDPRKRGLLKPEAIFEIETGLRQSAYDVTAASIVRSEWTQAVRRFFERYDFLILPTAQVFPFDIERHWPQEIAGRTMQTYHEWMKGTLFVSMCGCPALAAPAGFSGQGLPIGMQIIAPNRQELACLQLAYAHESTLAPARRRLPPLIGGA